MRKENIKSIIELQRMDEEIDRLNRRLKSIEREEQKLLQERDECVRELEELSAREKELSTRIKELKEFLEEEELRLKKTEEKMSMVRKDVEYRTLLREKSKHEDNILKTSYEVEELEEKLKELRHLIVERKSKLDRCIKDIEEELKDLEIERKTALEKIQSLNYVRNEAVKSIDSSLLSFYEEARRHFEGGVIVSVEDEACSGCGMKIPDILFSKMLKEDSIETCPSCGRYIYYRL